MSGAGGSVLYAVEFDLGDLVGHTAAGDVDGHFIAHLMAQQGAAHRGVDGNSHFADRDG